jgi:probable F420-dependent oxidoreductase
MKLDTGIPPSPKDVPDAARRAESSGFDGVWAAETTSDPFLLAALAAGATERVALGTNIAVAFARNPMTTATAANDLQTLSQGRFHLGLGSQIKAHITRRFSMPWSHPAARMREYVQALRAIWAAWNDGVPLNFRGDFYTHTLMTPFFSPPPNPYGPPKVYLAGVGQLMCAVVGEVADGFLSHSFTTESYLREVALPSVEQGRGQGGPAERLEVFLPAFVATGSDEKTFQAACTALRRQIAFYGSTPAYRPVLEHHGWGELQTELNVLSKQGRWEDMGTLIDDGMLDAFAVTGAPDEVGDKLLARFGDIVDRISLYAPGLDPSGPELAQVTSRLTSSP